MPHDIPRRGGLSYVSYTFRAIVKSRAQSQDCTQFHERARNTRHPFLAENRDCGPLLLRFFRGWRFLALHFHSRILLFLILFDNSALVAALNPSEYANAAEGLLRAALLPFPKR